MIRGGFYLAHAVLDGNECALSGGMVEKKGVKTPSFPTGFIYYSTWMAKIQDLHRFARCEWRCGRGHAVCIAV